MRKLFVFIIAIFLLYLSAIFFGNKAYAACNVSVTPNNIALNFKGQVTIASENDCFDTGTTYRIAAYPQTIKSIKDAYKVERAGGGIAAGSIARRPAVLENLKPLNEKTITATFDLTDSFLAKEVGPWNLLVCLNIGNIRDCNANFVGTGTIFVDPVALTATPTPQPDQPIIDPLQQSQCTFQYTENKDAAFTIIVNNIDSEKRYNSWWEDQNKDIVKNISPYPSQDTLRAIIWGDMIRKLNNPTDIRGHLFCVDVKDRKKTGSNCIRLFFTGSNPETEGIDTSCSLENTRNVKPTPISPLPQCSSWAYLNGTSIPGTSIAEQEKFIHDNRLSKKVKCLRIDTAIGDINVNPQGFVRSIFSLVLGLAGGIALILIIISGYRLMASQGNPEALTAARDQLISAIVGLLFIIFSFVILQVIGVDILKIPGFAK